MSPILFDVYMDDLSKQLSMCNTGCLVGNSVLNHIANDLVILSPYSAGLQQLLRVCSHHSEVYDMEYNAKKSNVMIVRSREDRKLVFSVFNLCDSPLTTCQDIKTSGISLPMT